MVVHPFIPWRFVFPNLFQILSEQGTDAFSQSGLYSNHQDIAPRYSVSGFIVPIIFGNMDSIFDLWNKNATNIFIICMLILDLLVIFS